MKIEKRVAISRAFKKISVPMGPGIYVNPLVDHKDFVRALRENGYKIVKI